MKLIYFGSPEMAVSPLRALIAAGHEIALVVSNPDTRRSRRGEPSPTPVKAAALEAGLRVTAEPDDVLGIDADLGVVVAFGQIIRPNLLDHLEMLNIHFSLLPRWRGAAPVERAILAGDTETGVCLMEVAEGLDTGGIYASDLLPIHQDSTARTLREDLVRLGTDLLIETLDGELPVPEPQSPEGVTYAKKLSPAEMEIDWSGTVEGETRKVRVGGAWSTFRGRRIKVLAVAPTEDENAQNSVAKPGSVGRSGVACADGVMEVIEVQPEGKRPMRFADWVNGAQPDPTELFGS